MDLTKISFFLQQEENRSFFRRLQECPHIDINELQKLEKENPEKPVKDLLTLIRLQKRNLQKIPDAERYIFSEKLVQQASSTRLAEYHAEKFQGFAIIADLCCGAGMDLLKLAVNKQKIFAVDNDIDSMTAAKYNSAQNRLKNIIFLQQNAEDFLLQTEAIFADPDRRAGKKREIGKDEIKPTLDELLNLRAITGNIAIKLSPAMDYKNLEIAGEHTLEFISEKGVLKEMLLCLGELAMPNIRRKAVILPQKIILLEKDVQRTVGGIKSYIFEPDAAVIRAGLVQECGEEIGFDLIDAKLALLSGEKPVRSELGRCFKVLKVTSCNLKELQKYCRQNEIGELVIKTRGFPEKAEDFRRKLKLQGKHKLLVFIVRRNKSHQFIFAAEEMKN